MNKDEIKGKAKDVAGRAERQVGEWTGDSGLVRASFEEIYKHMVSSLSISWRPCRG